MEDNILKIYVWYTENIEEYIFTLQQSAKDFKKIEIVPYLYDKPIDLSNLVMGGTMESSYKDLMLLRWSSLPNIIEENMGKNIVWLDADCVLNKNNKTFYNIISNCLNKHDFVFQYDNNDNLTEHINTGIMGIKCSEKTLNFINQFYDGILNTQNKRDGYPLLEMNESFKKYSSLGATFSLLPPDYCSGEGDWGIYHAIGSLDKLSSLKSKL